MPECVVAEGSTIERTECDPQEGRNVSASEEPWCRALTWKQGRDRQTVAAKPSESGFSFGIVIWTFKAQTAQCPPFPESTCCNLVSVTYKPKDSTHGNKIKDGICWSILESQEEFWVGGRGLGSRNWFCFHQDAFLFPFSPVSWLHYLPHEVVFPVAQDTEYLGSSESHWLITLAQDAYVSTSTLHKCSGATVTKCNMEF